MAYNKQASKSLYHGQSMMGTEAASVPQLLYNRVCHSSRGPGTAGVFGGGDGEGGALPNLLLTSKGRICMLTVKWIKNQIMRRTWITNMPNVVIIGMCSFAAASPSFGNVTPSSSAEHKARGKKWVCRVAFTASCQLKALLIAASELLLSLGPGPEAAAATCSRGCRTTCRTHSLALKYIAQCLFNAVLTLTCREA
jgi:hypothetical protein